MDIKVYNKKGVTAFFISLFILLGLLTGCTSTTKKEERTTTEPQEAVPIIESVDVTSTPTGSVLVLNSSRSTPYTAFQLVDPPRVVLDIRGKRSGNIPLSRDINNNILQNIRFEDSDTGNGMTRMVAALANPADYSVVAQDKIIRVVFVPKQTEAKAPQAAPPATNNDTPATASEPRIYFKPQESNINQVLGIDFTMLDHGKSQLLITTDKKVPYSLDQKGTKGLSLKLSNSTIPPLLLREIDATHFPAALERVRPAFSSSEKEVDLDIFLKEMVPYHIKQTDNRISIDFAKTSVKPPQQEIVPLQLKETKVTQASAPTKPVLSQSPAATTTLTPTAAATRVMKPPAQNAFSEKKYKEEPMSFDFNNTEVIDFLRMVNTISDENIIWDPEIVGRRFSMILKDVPWDQALELILTNAGLDKRYVGKNIIWVTTKAKMNQIKAEEEASALKEQQKIEEELKRKREMEEKAKEAEPIVTEYIPVDFAAAEEIKPHIDSIKTERGTITIDSRTNTFIIKDVSSSIAAAKEIIKQFDIPVKQIMIEARIVDATTDFSRDLGIRWGSDNQYWRRNENNVSFPVTDANSYTNDQKGWGGTFSTSTPDGWAGNIGLAFAQNFSGLGALTLDATLALAETEGKAKVMSAPKVIAREGTAATISSGDVIIIPATENVPSTTLNATLSLTVTPEAVSYNNYITLVITVTDDQAPSTQRLLTKNINTTLLIKSGDTFVIGGIIKESEAENESGVPGLRRIPILGKLFNAKRKTFQRSELLIFVTPTVLPPPA
ncbi:MAG: type IV pilus secretin PilQ [Deltaproteobacteria bacterium]|nr:type IV pilus secretin PilQ [Deltaproteobacteria bacterium]